MRRLDSVGTLRRAPLPRRLVFHDTLNRVIHFALTGVAGGDRHTTTGELHVPWVTAFLNDKKVGFQERVPFKGYIEIVSALYWGLNQKVP